MASWINRPLLCLIFLCVAIFIQPSQGGFDIAPDAASGVVPIGHQATFHCRASEGFVIYRWEVTPPTARTLSSIDQVELLHMLGIAVTFEMSMRESYLVINATNATDGSIVECEVEESANILNADKSTPVQTVFYGSPSPPTDLTVSGFQNGRLSLTWNFSSIPSVQVLFTLTVLKNNSYSRQEERNAVQNITETAAMIEIDYSFCDVFYFWVMAENDAGKSDMSTAAKWIPPYQPNFPALSLQHSLSRTAEGVFVTVAVNVPKDCPEYSAAIFDVVLDNQTGTVRIWRQSGMQNMQEQLEEDQIYFIQVESNGERLTEPEKIVTSDVQDIEVCLYDSTFILQCIFIPGSTISGCGYTLVHREGVANISGQIPRTNGRGGHVKVNETTDYLEIVVYDTPTGENLSNIGIPIVKSLRGLSSCPTTDNGNSGGTSHSSNNPNIVATMKPNLPLLAVILPVAIFTVVILSVAFILSITYCCRQKGYSFKLEKHEQERNGGTPGGGQRSKVQSRYSQGTKVADKECEDKYDLLSNALQSTRDSVSTRGSTSTRGSLIRASIPSARGSVSVRGSDATFGAGIDQQPPEVFRDDGDYSQLNMEPVYQVLEADNGSVSPATPSQPLVTPPGACREIVHSRDRPFSVQVHNPIADEADYAHINEGPVYQVLENDRKYKHHEPSTPILLATRNSTLTELPPPTSLPPALPSRSPNRDYMYKTRYADIQVPEHV